MDEEYHCKARPNMSSTVVGTNNISSHPRDKYFKIEFDYTRIWVQIDTNHQSLDIERRTLRKVSIDELMEETTIPSWLSHIKIPKEFFVLVAEEILRCARDMVNGTYKNLRFLCIRVDFSLAIPLEDDSCDEGDYGDEQNLCLEEDGEEIEEDGKEIEVEEDDNVVVPPITSVVESEFYEDDYELYDFEDEEEMEVEEEDNVVVPLITSVVESEFYEDNYELYDFEEDEEEMEVEEEDNVLVPTRAIESESYEDDYELYFEDDFGGYEGNYDLEEDEEEMEVEEVDNRFVPAAKSFIEELKTVKVEEVEKCAICFEDFIVGVRIPCSHMFHMSCIRDWLVIGNSCPLCRFQLPT